MVEVKNMSDYKFMRFSYKVGYCLIHKISFRIGYFYNNPVDFMRTKITDTIYMSNN